MENVNKILAENICMYRKKKGLTQEGLAEKLGVTFQAVSKWETAKSAPDILFLPILADIFGCYIDELFSQEVKKDIHYDYCPQFPWHDDMVIRGVVCEGRKILQVTDNITSKFTFEIIGDAKSVQSECDVTISGSVSGGCSAGKDVVVGGSLSGACNCGMDVTVGGNVLGDCNCGMNVTVGGNLTGDITCGDTVTTGGDIEADTIKGNVECAVLKCEKIEGNVIVNKE